MKNSRTTWSVRMRNFVIGAVLTLLATSASANEEFPSARIAGSSTGVSTFSASQYVQDSGRIEKIYLAGESTIAVRLDGGFPNATATGTCPTASYWAGKLTAEKSLIASLMSAKASGQKVTMGISGCDGNGGWFRISDLYLSD